jgi:phosphotransferase system HPr (HPr) family protein
MSQPESGQPAPGGVKSSPDSLSATTQARTEVTINHPLGLHLRKGKDVVQAANQFKSEITAQNLSRHSPVVDAKSILQLMQLQARQGHTIRLTAVGEDAQTALATLSALFAHRYYDVPEAP